jgi:uncharacterized membrane protein
MPRRIKSADVALIAFGIAYPPMVFFLRGTVDASLFIGVALACLGLRLLASRGEAAYWRPALLVCAVAVTCLALLDRALAVYAYPVVLSLAASGVFAITLLQPVSLVEKLALASGQTWSPQLRAYCRAVTGIWAIWLAVNAAVAAGLALAGSTSSWALWTGAISYLVSGALFAGEWLVRRNVVQQQLRR